MVSTFEENALEILFNTTLIELAFLLVIKSQNSSSSSYSSFFVVLKDL
jgi:hypothetical protein